MTTNLFQTPEPKTIGGKSFQVIKVPFDSFDAAITFGEWLINQAGGKLDMAALSELKDDSPVKNALNQLLAACLSIQVEGEYRQLTVQDVGTMPIPMVMEAAYVVMGVNLDFFIQTLQAVKPLQGKLMSIGSQLLSSSLPPATTSNRSGATATAS